MNSILIRVLEKLYLLLVFTFIALPIAVIIVFSFNEGRFPSFPWSGFSFRWYEAIFNEPMVIDSAINSFIVGLFTAIGATIIGFLAAYLDYRYKFRGKSALNFMVVIPPAIPPTVMGIALLAFLSRVGVFGELKSIIFAHIAIASSFSMALISQRLKELDSSIEPAAWNLGATRLQGLLFVIIPHCRNAIFAAFFLSFAISFDEFMISWFVGGMNETLPVRILNLLQGQVSPRINSIGTLIFTLTFSLVISALWFMRKKPK